MGGNALKTVKLVRLDREGYDKITNKIYKVLDNHNIVARRTLSYENKPDFGDLDILIKSSTIPNINMRDFIQDNFNPKEIYHNGDAWSFDFKKFQIDFILVSDENWITSNVYFSYNDLGNFMGRIAYQMGFRYGDYGLKLNYFYDSKKFSMNISKDPEKIFEFLGFDWGKYSKGFHSLTDIFEYIVGSKYFSSSVFDYENLNHQNRTRNKKRKNYQLFLDYVNENAPNATYDYKSQDEYIREASRFFQVDVRTEIEKWKVYIEQEKNVKEKFNGNQIMENYGLKGKVLGDSIKKYKDYVETKHPEGFVSYILTTGSNIIFDEFEKINNIN